MAKPLGLSMETQTSGCWLHLQQPEPDKSGYDQWQDRNLRPCASY